MKDLTLQDIFTIDEILHEAGAYDLRFEVQQTAMQLYDENIDDEYFKLVDAYQQAFNEWIK